MVPREQYFTAQVVLKKFFFSLSAVIKLIDSQKRVNIWLEGPTNFWVWCLQIKNYASTSHFAVSLYDLEKGFVTILLLEHESGLFKSIVTIELAAAVAGVARLWLRLRLHAARTTHWHLLA